MAEHPWCRDVGRDEAVRAAEDAVERPAVPDWRELPERVAALEREVAALRAPVEAEAKAKAETTDGLRTERVTLEITRPHRPNYPASATDFPWPHILREVVCGERESVRVVPAAEGDYFDDLAQVAMERDAAIRERDAAMERVAHLEGANRAMKDAADTACDLLDESKARVAELEKQRADAEPVAFRWEAGNMIFNSEERAKEYAESSLRNSCPVVPLFRSPPQPRGWLTGDQRATLACLVARGVGAPYRDVLDSILKSNSPPKVRLKVLPPHAWKADSGPLDGWRDCLGMVGAALAAAGVEVEEVGRE